MPLLPIAQGLVNRGVKVFIAYRDLSKLSAIYGQVGVSFLQAPIRMNGQRFFVPGLTFTHIMANVGFGDEGELFALACAWRNLIGLVVPDLIICDYSPMALLGSSGFPIRRAVVGFGFCTPPDVSPLPIVNRAGAANIDPAQFLKEEGALLTRINKTLGVWKQPPLERVSQLFSKVDENILATFPEIDHFGPRSNAKYWGPLGGEGGESPLWPKATGDKKIFAYLKPGPYLNDVLVAFKEMGHSTILFAHEVPPAALKNHQASNICFEYRRLDPKIVAAQADCAVLNATHGTTLDFLLAGKPIIQLPLTLEQELIAHVTTRTGAVIVPNISREITKNLKESISSILSDAGYRQKAQAIADKYKDFDRNQQLNAILDRLYQLTMNRDLIA